MTSRTDKNTESKWSSRQLLDWTSQYFQSKAVDSPRLAAEMLLAHVLEVPRIKLYMDMDRLASPLERAAYKELIERAVAQEPVQYLVGSAPFFSLDFEVNSAVLIPRGATETLVEHVIQTVRQVPGFATPVIADVGTGSGCIAVTLAKNLPDATIIATDISEEALALAKCNAAKHEVADRIDFRQGDLFEPLQGMRFHFLVSNPPYIPDSEWEEVAANVKDYEPVGALRAGVEGMDCLGPMLDQCAEYLEKPGQLVFEIASSQKEVVLASVESNVQLSNGRVMADAEGLDRALIAERV